MRALTHFRNYTSLTLALTGPSVTTPIIVPPRASARSANLTVSVPFPVVGDPARFTGQHCLSLAAYRGEGTLEQVWNVLIASSESDGGLIYLALAKDAGSFANTRVIEPWPVPQALLPPDLMLSVSQKYERAWHDLHVSALKHETHQNGDSGGGGGGAGGDGPG